VFSGSLDYYHTMGLKGLEAEKKAASLLFSEYVPNSTPAGTVKHL